MKLLKNPITRYAILFTLGMLFVYRFGYYIITPLIDGTKLVETTDSSLNTLFNFMGGGNLGQLTVFALGVSPYITASIVIQLLETDLVPAMAEWKHQGVEGQNKRSNWTKYLSIGFGFLQAIAIIFGMNIYQSFGIIRHLPFAPGTSVQWYDYIVISLFITAGTAILMWVADRITEKGIGNGMSVIIMVGILARVPMELERMQSTVTTAMTSGNVQEEVWTIATWVLLFILMLILTVGVVIYTLAERRVKINYVKNSKGSVAENSYLPIRLNPAGVIPVIFVTPLMQIPYLITLIPAISKNGHGKIEHFFMMFFNMNTTDAWNSSEANPYWWVAVLTYFILIVLFSIMYSYIQMNPEQMSENLEKQSAYIVGVRPGAQTIKYLVQVITKNTIYGGTYLAVLATLTKVLENTVPVLRDNNIQLQLMGTGLIITVNVIVQTHQAMINKAESKTYKKLI